MIKVGVLRGGSSPEYGVSLKTGEHILRYLREEPLSNKYEAIDILIDREGVLHYKGLAIPMERLPHLVDVIINALHGYYGEDGKIQNEFEKLGLKYTGSGPFASAVGMNKVLAKEEFAKHGINAPMHIIMPSWHTANTKLSLDEYVKYFTQYIFQKMPPPWVIKPVSSGSSDRVSLAKTLPVLEQILFMFSEDEDDLMVEEHIEGREVSVGIVEGLRGENLYNTPIVEIRKPKQSIFSYSHKYEEPTARALGKFTEQEKQNITDTAKLVHKHLGLSQYSETDMILHPRRGIYVLEVNTLPGLTETSLLPYALDSVGVSMSEFIEHLIQTAELKSK